MTDITWTHPRLDLILNAIPGKTQSLVDVGCGRGIIGALSRVYRNIERTVGLDIHEPYLERCRRYRFYDEMVSWDIRKVPFPLGNGEFEVATCVEVLEHLPKDMGMALLEELERIADMVIITTPSIYYEQEELDSNPHQRHLSLWKVSDFSSRGYTISGVGPFKLFGRTFPLISPALAPLSKPFPRLSALLLCVRDGKQRHRT